MQQLLEHAADLEDGEGRMALHHAAANGSGGIIHRLLENGARPSNVEGQKVLQVIWENLEALRLEKQEEGEQILRLLLEKGMEGNVKVSTDIGVELLGWTTQRYSRYGRDVTEMAVRIAKLLVDHGAEARRTIPSKSSTALWSAVARAPKKVLAEVLRAKDLTNDEGKKALKALMEDIKSERLASPDKLKLLKEALEQGSAYY